MKLIVISLISLLLISCTSNYEVPTEKSEPGFFSKDSKKGLSISDFLNKDPYDDKSFYTDMKNIKEAYKIAKTLVESNVGEINE